MKFGYKFGSLITNTHEYTADLMILPAPVSGQADEVIILENWRRQMSHQVAVYDIRELVRVAPDLIVIGTGAESKMQPAPDLEEILLQKNIDLICEDTRQAVWTFNELLKSHRKVGAAFHLTC